MRAKPMIAGTLISCRKVFFNILLLGASGAWGTEDDHREFSAMLHAPFLADSQGERTLALQFSYPDQEQAHHLDWRLDLLSNDGRVVQHWEGQRLLDSAPQQLSLPWRSDPALAAGIYRLRLRAEAAGAPTIEQSWPVQVGAMRQRQELAPLLSVPAFRRRYRVYLGNLHSQTRHSDGGGPVALCHGAQQPQSGAYGPADAYAYAQQHGLDFLMTSEHNHMYDGSDGSNPDAVAATAKALYQSGLASAAAYRRAHPGFLPIYGQEWGVISHGGHLNIFNSPELLGWERNAGGDLLADEETPKSDYAALYTLMRRRGWIGQFNHPQPDQFAVAGQPLAYTADGGRVMALCEVMNSSAFSNHEDEAEPYHGNFEASCDSLLSAGYRLAFSSDQDNHCANWGAAYSNRTGVLIPRGQKLNAATLLVALRARRVFATMDKTALLLLSANGHLMGERFRNRGALRLTVHYASSSGHRAAALTIFHGVPGARGAIDIAGHDARLRLTPAAGPHFYYARLTQDDGKMLWSAPVWVDQRSRNRALRKIESR